MHSRQSGALLSRQPQENLRPLRMNSLKLQPREAMGLQSLRQKTYFGEASSSEGPLQMQEREARQLTERRASDAPVMEVLHRVTHAQKNRQLEESKEELQRIKSRVDATVEAYEESSRQVFDSYKSRATITFLEDLDQLETLLSDVLERKRYEQQVTVFIVGFQETCEQQEQVLVQLHEFFHKNSRFPLDYEETADRDDLVLDDSTQQHVQETLVSSENTTRRLLDLSKEMMSYMSILDSKGTKKGRKRIEKALNQSKDDVNQLTEKLLAAHEGMEEKEETLKELLKQNEIKTLESHHFRTQAAATKRMLETCQQDWELQRTLLQRQVVAAAARAQQSEEAHRQATAQVENLARLAEEQAKQLQPEEETLGGKSSEKGSTHGDTQLPAKSPERPLSAVSSPSPPTSPLPPRSPGSMTVAVHRRGSDSRLGEAPSPRCGSERSGSPTSLKVAGSRSEGSRSERSNPSPVAEGHLPEESTRLAHEQNWDVARIHELENEITGLMESKQSDVNALKEKLKCSKASWEKERLSLQEKVNQMVQLQKLARRDFRQTAIQNQVPLAASADDTAEQNSAALKTVARSWNAETRMEGDALVRENSFSAGSESKKLSSPLTDGTTASLTQDCPSCQRQNGHMRGETEALVFQEFLKVYSCTMHLRGNVVELLVNGGMASAASGLQGVQQLTAGATGDMYLQAQSMSTSIHTVLNETTAVISLLSEARTSKELLPQHRDKMLVDDPHDLTPGCEDARFHHGSDVPAEGSLQGSASMVEDGLKITGSLEMLSSSGSMQQVLSSTPVYGESPNGNSVEQMPVSNVKVVCPALGMEEPQASAGFLTERVHSLEQELQGKQLEFDEERERNMKLVAELRKQIRALQRSALWDDAGSPADATSAQVLESTVFFTRTDMEHNVRKLRQGLHNEQAQRGHFEDATSAMEKIVAVQRTRLVMMVERYIQHVNMSRIRDNVSRNYSSSRPVCDLLQRMETMQSKRHRRWSKQMVELGALRIQLVEQLTRTLRHIEEENGMFLIKPYLCWVSSVKSRDSKCKKVPHRNLVEKRWNASNALTTPPPSPVHCSAASFQKHCGRSLRVQGSWPSQGLRSSSLKPGNACKTDNGSSCPSGVYTSSTIAIPHHPKRSLQKPPCHQHHASPRRSPDGVKLPSACQDDEGRSHRIFINSGQTTACQTTQLLFGMEQSSQDVLPPLLTNSEPSKDTTLCGWVA